MNYRHIFHAGNFADVFKHCVLIALLESFYQKETPICYLETHAGRGIYDLTRIKSQKDKEYTLGIDKLLKLSAAKIYSILDSDVNPHTYRMINPIINRYIEIVKSYAYPNFYPGSPLIAKSCLRTKDTMILMELHPEEHLELKQLLKYNANVALHFQDGYAGLKAFLPPKERRGLVLIDPPFEKKDEWEKILKSIQIAIKRFQNGVYAIWYPLKDKVKVKYFKDQLINMNLGEILFSELSIYPPDAELGLPGCGMMIINPPWQLKTSLQGFVPILWRLLSIQELGGYSIENLNSNLNL